MYVSTLGASTEQLGRMTSTYINNVEAKLELGSIQICCTESFDQTTNSVACSLLNRAVCASLCCCSDNLFAGKLFQLKKNGAFDCFTTETADLFFSQNSVFVFVFLVFFLYLLNCSLYVDNVWFTEAGQ